MYMVVDRPQRRRPVTKAQKIGDVEMEILQIVWSLEEATVQDVLDRILRRRRVAYTSVMTMMRKLSEKGLLKYRAEGRSYVYSAAVNPRTIKRRLLRDTVDKVFGGSPVELFQNLVETEKLTDEEVRELKRIIREL
jgi:predicted transcriptional regulator